MNFWSHVSQHIATTTGRPFSMTGTHTVGGGCINATYLLADGQQKFFVKRNAADRVDMFQAEVDGLKEIAATGVIRVPQPICCGVVDDSAYIVLEHIALGTGNRESSELLGRHLANMHRVTQTNYGWWRRNTIGSTPQLNDYADDWTVFWRERRLKFQLRLLRDKGYSGSLPAKIERLMDRVPGYMAGYAPPASLLHGDLWSGNYAADEQGVPVIFDPAVYYGDREADIAMTELFGGFPQRFYRAYEESYPLDSGYSVRKTLYNLYHILNHINLFGGGYASQAERMVDRLLSEV